MEQTPLYILALKIELLESKFNHLLNYLELTSTDSHKAKAYVAEMSSKDKEKITDNVMTLLKEK